VSTFGSGTFGSGTFGNSIHTFTVVPLPTSAVYMSRFGDTTKYQLSSVNRRLSIDEQKLGKSQVLAGGRTVRDIIDTKKIITVQWDLLPHLDSMTKDGGVGFRTIIDQLYEYTGDHGQLTIEIPDGTGGLDKLNVFIDPSSTAEMQRIYSGQHNAWQTVVKNPSMAQGSTWIRVWDITNISPGDEFIVQDSAGHSDTYMVKFVSNSASEKRIWLVDGTSTLREYLGDERVTQIGTAVTSGRNIYWNVNMKLIEI
jgi:hypothetical protein